MDIDKIDRKKILKLLDDNGVFYSSSLSVGELKDLLIKSQFNNNNNKNYKNEPGIYMITNVKNNWKYIGQSRDIKKRIDSHKSFNNRNEEKRLYFAFEEWGIENFTFEVIEYIDVTKLDERERFWINEYNTVVKGYNQQNGGAGNKVAADYNEDLYWDLAIQHMWPNGFRLTNTKKKIVKELRKELKNYYNDHYTSGEWFENILVSNSDKEMEEEISTYDSLADFYLDYPEYIGTSNFHDRFVMETKRFWEFNVDIWINIANKYRWDEEIVEPFTDLYNLDIETILLLELDFEAKEKDVLMRNLDNQYPYLYDMLRKFVAEVGKENINQFDWEESSLCNWIFEILKKHIHSEIHGDRYARLDKRLYKNDWDYKEVYDDISNGIKNSFDKLKYVTKNINHECSVMKYLID